MNFQAVTSPTEDENKVANGEEQTTENGHEAAAAEAEKPTENAGESDTKPAENGETAETNGDGKQKKSLTLRLTRMLSK